MLGLALALFAGLVVGASIGILIAAMLFSGHLEDRLAELERDLR